MKYVVVTGGTGLVGNGIRSISHKYPHIKFIYWGSKDVDLCDYDRLLDALREASPDSVIHLASNVGGLFKNMTQKVDMFEKNIIINTNVLRACHQLSIKKVVCCLSTCIFPDKTTYPITESMLHDGPPHNSNSGYAYAKRMLDVHRRAYREQYGDMFVSVIPTNVYGEHDNYHLEDAHVLPALIHKCYIAKMTDTPFVVSGSGTPLRQFIYSQDLAVLMVRVLLEYDDVDSIILSPDPASEVSIGYVASCVAKCFNYEHRLIFDTTLSDGQYKKTADNSRLRQVFGDVTFTNIEEGIQKSVEWFQSNYPNVRM